jgi:hypothetical protein
MLVLIALLVVTVAVGLVPGLALFAIVPGVLLLAYAAWFVLTVASGRTPEGVVRSRGRRGPELLVPGGPDDPEQTRS